MTTTYKYADTQPIEEISDFASIEDEVVGFWRHTMNNPVCSVRDRLNASELIAKHLRMFTDNASNDEHSETGVVMIPDVDNDRV